MSKKQKLSDIYVIARAAGGHTLWVEIGPWISFTTQFPTGIGPKRTIVALRELADTIELHAEMGDLNVEVFK